MSIALSVVVMALLSVLARTAKAEPPNQKAMPVYVLSILTEDADDQADALTTALRDRVRKAPGLSLLETPQSLETLTIALRCPPHPDTGCLQRIGDQLHADHYLWAFLKKKGSDVQVDAHFWSRGRPQLDATETYSENLKDPGDEALKAMAAKIVGELTGTGIPGGGSSGGGGSGKSTGSAASGPGTLVVHAGNGGGTVMVDGAEKGTLDGGTARIEIPEGSHTVTVHVPGFQAPSLTTSVKAGSEKEVSFALATAGQGGEESSPAGETAQASKPFPTKKVVGWSLVGAGVILAVVAVIEVSGWVSDKNDSDNQRSAIPANITDACSVPMTAPYYPSAQRACSDSKDATDKSTFAWATGAGALVAGGVGAFLLMTDHDSSETAKTAPAPAPKPRLAVAPVLGPHEGGLRLRLDF